MFIFIVGALIIPRLVYGNDHPYIQEFDSIAYFCGYWILLGIASSIGLGTGLHTFVLYLGPYIANVALAAYKCQAAPVHLPSRWNFQYFQECPEPTEG